MQTKDTAYHSW